MEDLRETWTFVRRVNKKQLINGDFSQQKQEDGVDRTMGFLIIDLGTVKNSWEPATFGWFNQHQGASMIEGQGASKWFWWLWIDDINWRRYVESNDRWWSMARDIKDTVSCLVQISMPTWLVVYLPLWKIFISWDDDIPNIWKVIIQSCSKPPTSHI